MNAPSEIVEAPARLFNRELSWLAFNRRVLEEATNPAHPLLERLRFLSISGSNLDEFFMVRVAGLKGHQLQGVDDLSADGMTATQQLDAIAEEALRFISERVERSYWMAERVVEAIDRFAIAERARLTLPTIRRALGEGGIIDSRGAA